MADVAGVSKSAQPPPSTSTASPQQQHQELSGALAPFDTLFVTPQYEPDKQEKDDGDTADDGNEGTLGPATEETTTGGESLKLPQRHPNGLIHEGDEAEASAALDGSAQAAIAEPAHQQRSQPSKAAPSQTNHQSKADELNRLVLEKFTCFETKTKLYIVASNQSDSRYRVLKIDRAAPPSRPSTRAAAEDEEHQDDGQSSGLNITEDAAVYNKAEIEALMTTLEAGNGGAPRSEPKVFYGIAGFVRFTSTYYMILVKQRAPVALIGGHYIYHCEETILRPITPPSGSRTAEEARQMAAFQGVDLSKNFYFSYTYDLTHTLQHNLTRITGNAANPPSSAFNDKWVWNRHLLRPAFHGHKSNWLVPLIHGFVDQAKLSVFGRTVYITIIARRSRHFAGARFLKRGVNDQGFVANDVETEQVVSEALTTPFHSPAPATHRHPHTGVRHQNRRPNPRYTSFVQVRGSIPLYWSQESVNMSPKPPIELTIVDPYYSAAALHFDDLLGRYGAPITVLNLIKQKERAPRESKLLPEFKQCIDYLNQFLPEGKEIVYIPWDIAAANKQRDKDVIGILEDIAEESMEKTSFFHSGPEPTLYALHQEEDCPPYRSTPLLQTGVVRTNCIDCLDRTNAAQFVIAKAALGHQLHALGVIHDPRLPFDSDAVNLITEMYHDHGDTIALQYGGSHLVNTMETYRKIGQWTSHSRETIENLRRYYANSFVDADKQAAIDLFLGIEPSIAPLPSYPGTLAGKNPRRSYRDWFTPAHLEQTLTPAETEDRLRRTVQHEDDGTSNYWQVYYRPKLLTDLSKHFAFKVNSTLKYKPVNLSGEGPEQSPFVPRLAPHQTASKLPVGGVRRWMSHRGTAPADRDRQHALQHLEDVKKPPATSQLSLLPPPTTTEGIVARLLNPAVEERDEYVQYVRQFDQLSLAQDLSEKDAALYKTSAGLAALQQLKVDEGTARLYADAVAVARGLSVVR